MISIKEATEEMFEQIYPLLQTFSDARSTASQWKSLFSYTWPPPRSLRGFVLMDDNRIVGFQGATTVERLIDGRPEVISNLNTWITLPEYRKHALLLSQAVDTIENCTLTVLTPLPAFERLHRLLGCKTLETHSRILYPFPAFREKGSVASLFRYRCTTNPDKIARRLEGEDLKIFEHHRPHNCGHMLVYNKKEYCYIVFTRMKGRRVWFANIQAISNKALFLRSLDRIRVRLAVAARAPLIMFDSRFVGDVEIPWSWLTALRTPRLYKSDRLEPFQIDNLYTEMVLLDI